MDKVAEYRRHANEVRELAETESNTDDRKNLFALADLWMRLAAEQERMLDATRGAAQPKTLRGIYSRLFG